MTLEYTKHFLEEMAQNLNYFPDKREMLEYLIEYGKDLKDLPEKEKIPENAVPGCVSGVYVTFERKNDKCYFSISSSSLIVRGYVKILMTALNGLTKEEFLHTEPLVQTFIEQTNIAESLISSRANAFGNIYKKMREKTTLP